MKKTGEAAVQAAILEWLAARHILAFRMQSGATVSTYKGKTRMFRYGTPGMADILAFDHWFMEQGLGHGHFIYKAPIWIECKALKGKQSELQKSFQSQVEADGHRYIIARSIEDVEAEL